MIAYLILCKHSITAKRKDAKENKPKKKKQMLIQNTFKALCTLVQTANVENKNLAIDARIVV